MPLAVFIAGAEKKKEKLFSTRILNSTYEYVGTSMEKFEGFT